MLKRIAAIMIALLLVPAVARADEIGTSAKACIIIDERSGRVLLSHRASEPLPMASTTKIMTALLALEKGDLDAQVTCSRNAFGVPGTSIYLSEGETLSLRHMLYGLMLASGNDAATAIAEHIGGSIPEFCRLMTERAAELGCMDTVFLTPHGLPQEGHYTTAHDLALITREAMTHEFFRELVSTQRATIPWENRPYDRVLNNKNRLLSSYEGTTGVKTGYTKKAGRCLVFGAERDGMRIIGVVLNCADWFDEAARLMDTAFERYESVTMMERGDLAGTVPVTLSNGRSTAVILAESLIGVIHKGLNASVAIDMPESVVAPVMCGQMIGTVRLMEGETVIAEVPLIAADDVPRDDFPARWQMYWQNWHLVP